ncbi:hypothetical protein EVG20_g6300, partial [Dentipellis fragilis]
MFLDDFGQASSHYPRFRAMIGVKNFLTRAACTPCAPDDFPHARLLSSNLSQGAERQRASTHCTVSSETCLVSRMSPHTRHYLVAGGAGFLGSYIVEALVARGEDHVAVYDLTEPNEADKLPTVSYFRGDICDTPRLVDVLRHTQTTIVFHVASPVRGLPDSIYTCVNVKGTRTLLEACRHPSLNGAVGKLVYTSSTGVVWMSKELAGVSEDEVSIPDKGFDAYHHTKAVAESMVLGANKDGLRTVAMRPCGMIGPRDGQLLFRLARLLADGQHKIQIGDNSASIDWVYPGNVADAHLLAADRLPWPA